MDRSDDETPDNLIPFRRIGFAPPTPPQPPAPPAAPEAEPTPAPPVGEGTTEVLDLPARPRRSPLAVVSELREPGLAEPTFDDDLNTPAASDGAVPDTFLPGPAAAGGYRPAHGQHLGALSLAAALAVAVAALRGIHTMVQARRASREQQRAVDRVAGGGSSSGSGGRGRGGGRVQSGPEFGRSAAGRGGGRGSGGGRGGAGGGKGRPDASGNRSGGRGNSGPGPGTGGDRGKDKTRPHKNTPRRPNSSGSGSGAGGRGNGRGGAGGSGGGKAKGPGVHRGSQGGTSRLLDRARRKQLTPGASGSTKGKHGPGGKGGKHTPSSTGPAAKRHGKNHGPAHHKTKQHGKQQHPKQQQKGKNGRVTLAEALYREAERRMKLRRAAMTPPIWSVRKNPKTAPPTGPATGQKAGAQGATAGKGTGPAAGPKTTTTNTTNGGYWGKARARARSYWQRRHYGPAGAPGYTGFTTNPGTGPGGPSAAGTSGPHTGGPGGNRQRRSSPWQAAATATAQTPGAYKVTLQRLDNVGDAARNRTPAAGIPTARPGLGPAPVKNFPRPGTRRPRPMPPVPPTGAGPKEKNRMATLTPSGSLPGRRHVPGMDDQHATEVTLDDVCDLLEELTADSFATHDQCKELAARAANLRERLLALAAELAVTHNVIGAFTSAALANLAEDMEILARQSEVMSVESLHAAEATEAADTAMNDAYRPITQAAADAGLLAPSAPVHNQS